MAKNPKKKLPPGKPGAGMSKLARKKRARREALAKTAASGSNSVAGPQGVDTGWGVKQKRIQPQNPFKLGDYALLQNDSNPSSESHADSRSPVKPLLVDRLQDPPSESPSYMDIDSNDEASVEDSAATQLAIAGIRNILVPIITKNIEKRRLSSQSPIQSKEILHAKVSSLLTDERCKEFAQISNRLKTKVSDPALGVVLGLPEVELSKFLNGIRTLLSQPGRKDSGTSFGCSLASASLSSPTSTPPMPRTPATHQYMEEGELPIFTDPFNGSFDSDVDYFGEPVLENNAGKERVTGDDEVEEGQVVEGDLHLSESQPHAPIPQSSHELPISTQGPIPGTWLFMPGAQASEVLQSEFFIEEPTHQAIVGWCARHRPSTLANFPKPVSLHIQSIPKAAMLEANARMDGKVCSQLEIVRVLWEIPTKWPTAGQLMIKVNDSKDIGRTWFAHDMVQNKPLDISVCAHTGTNVIKIVQLGDLSDYVFLLHATLQEIPLPTSAAWERYEGQVRTMIEART